MGKFTSFFVLPQHTAAGYVWKEQQKKKRLSRHNMPQKSRHFRQKRAFGRYDALCRAMQRQLLPFRKVYLNRKAVNCQGLFHFLTENKPDSGR